MTDRPDHWSVSVDLPRPAAARAADDSTFAARLVLTSRIDDLAQWWPRFDGSRDGACFPFQLADHLEAWLATIGKARRIRPIFAAVFDPSDHPLLFLPLGIEQRGRVSVLTFLDGGVCDYNAPVLFDASKHLTSDDVRTIWNLLHRHVPHVDVVMFEKMPDRVGDRANPWIVLADTDQRFSAHTMNLDGRWEDYAARRLPRKQDSGRKRRKLRGVGALSFEIAEGSLRQTELLSATIRQKSEQFFKTGAGGFNPAGKLAYYHATTELLAPKGLVRIAALTLDRVPLATVWGLFDQGRFFLQMPSHDQGQWSRYSVGRLLIEDLIQWGYGHGARVFDFGIGDEAYKLEYSDSKVTLRCATLAYSLAGKLYLARLRLLERLRSLPAWQAARALRWKISGKAQPTQSAVDA
jgi:CelD/BcsL family acetyltransferase involved in cellulose biosynthesis